MRIEITKNARDDQIAITRLDGSRVVTRFPKKGSIPHDAVHLFVEEELGLAEGFWGLVGKGLHPEAIAALAKESGHPSVARPAEPDEDIVQLLQSERLVECFEADFWSTPTDIETFLSVVAAACRQSLIPAPKLTEDFVERTRMRINAFAQKWRALPEGGSVELCWSGV